MTLRKITSLTALLSFLFMILTSIVLYIVPEGRVAYWADWRLWGLSKTQWGALHVNFGFLFILFGILHMYYNWKPMLSYLKKHGRKLTVFTLNFNMALILAVVCAVGTYFEMPPFRWIQRLGESIKDAGSRTYGEPPYGHAELSSLKLLTRRMGLDLAESMTALEKASIRVESETQSILEIAKANGLTPKAVYGKMLPEPASSKGSAMPEFPQSGLGKRSIVDVCGQYGVDVTAVLEGLNNKGIRSTADMTFKEIADRNNTSPADIYAMVYELAFTR